MKHFSLLCLCVLSFGCGQQAKSISPIVETRVSEFASVLSVTKSVDAKADESLALLKELVGKVDTLQSSAEESRQAIGTLQVVKEEPAVEEPPVEEVVSDDAIVVSTTDDLRLQFWTATWCVLCPAAKEQAQAAADVLEVELEIYDIDKYASQKEKCKVKAPPTLCIVYDGMTRKWLKGINSKEKILLAVEAVRSGNVASVPDMDAIAPMDFPYMKAMHDSLHGGGNWTWPGDLATHLREVHGVDVASTAVSMMHPQASRTQSRSWSVTQNASCPDGNCPKPRRFR